MNGGGEKAWACPYIRRDIQWRPDFNDTLFMDVQFLTMIKYYI